MSVHREGEVCQCAACCREVGEGMRRALLEGRACPNEELVTGAASPCECPSCKDEDAYIQRREEARDLELQDENPAIVWAERYVD